MSQPYGGSADPSAFGLQTKDDATTAAVVDNVKEFAQSVRFLGSYAKHVALEDRSHTEMPWTAYI